MRFTVVALNALPAVEPESGMRIGGLETFAWRLSRGIARHTRSEIQFVVRSPTKRTGTIIDQVRLDFIHEPLREVRQRVSKSLDFNSGSKFPRLKHWAPSLLWQVPWLGVNRLLMPRFSEPDALCARVSPFRPDIVLTLGVNQTSVQLAAIADSLQIPIVLWIQSNADLDERFFGLESYIDPYGVSSDVARECFVSCKNIICQTETQREKLNELTSTLPSSYRPHRVTVIPNPIEVCDDKTSLPGFEDRQGVLWIGRADRFHKRPLLALDIAKQCPDIPFTMVLHPGDDEVLCQVKDQLPTNVQLEDYVPAQRMPEKMRKSKLFLSTGSVKYEGFPNVLVESSANGTPIISLEDFDGYLNRSHCGLSADEDVGNAARSILQLYHDEVQWKQMSRNGIDYVLEHHETDAIVTKFVDWCSANA